MKAPVAALQPSMVSVAHLKAWASMPTVTGQASIRSGVAPESRWADDDPRRDHGRAGLERRRRPDRVGHRLPSLDGDALRPRVLRAPDGVRRGAQAPDDWGGQPDTSVRDARPDLLHGAGDHCAGHRSRPLRARRQLGSDDGHGPRNRHARHRSDRRHRGAVHGGDGRHGKLDQGPDQALVRPTAIYL